MDEKEKQIIELIRLGENEGYKAMFMEHYSVLCGFAESFTKNRFQAESIVSDVFFHIWEIRKKLVITTSLRSYLLRAVRNRCINYVTRENKKTFSKLPDENKVGFADSLIVEPSGELIGKEAEKELADALEEMPEKTKMIFKKSREEGLTYKQIAESTGESIDVVKYHIKRAIAFLTSRLAKYFILIIFPSGLTLFVQFLV